MKMYNLNVENLAGGKVKVSAEMKDAMRRPAGVKVELAKGELAPGGPSVILEGDRGEVGSTLACLAEVAWNMGWRPPGLGPTLANMVEQYKFRTT